MSKFNLGDFVILDRDDCFDLPKGTLCVVIKKDSNNIKHPYFAIRPIGKAGAYSATGYWQHEEYCTLLMAAKDME